jgi:hypothetical protein
MWTRTVAMKIYCLLGSDRHEPTFQTSAAFIPENGPFKGRFFLWFSRLPLHLMGSLRDNISPTYSAFRKKRGLLMSQYFLVCFPYLYLFPSTPTPDFLFLHICTIFPHSAYLLIWTMRQQIPTKHLRNYTASNPVTEQSSIVRNYQNMWKFKYYGNIAFRFWNYGIKKRINPGSIHYCS